VRRCDLRNMLVPHFIQTFRRPLSLGQMPVIQQGFLRLGDQELPVTDTRRPASEKKSNPA